jgi:hypothetical protein
MKVQLYEDAAAGIIANKLLDVGNGAVLVDKEGQLVYEDFAHVPTQEMKILHMFQPKNPVRIRVRIDPPHPLVYRKRRLNGAVLRMRPEEPRSRVSRCGTIKIPPSS